MNNKHCTQCRTERSNVIMSKKMDKRYQDFSQADIIYTHGNLGISFDDKATQNEVLSLLRFNCPLKNCGEICGSWKELKRHTQEKHHLKFCDLCTRHKKQFTNEFELYNARDLSKHEREGDNKGFSGHPRCTFCSMRFYSDDELFVHLRENHEKCPICSKNNPNKPQYFKDSASLQEHFRSAHYPCMVQSCIDLKLVAFKDEIDLRAHMIEEHPLLYGNLKSARTLDLDFGFNKGFQSKLSTVGSSDNSANSASSSNNKGKNKNKPNTNTTDNETPASEASARPLSQSNNPDAFPSLGSRPRAQFSSLSASFGQPSSSNSIRAKDSPVDIAQRRLDERVRNALNYDVAKFSQFEAINQKYLDSHLEPTGFISEYKGLFPNVNQEEMDAMIRDFTKINVKQVGKVKALSKAWEDHNMKSHFPSLGGNIQQRAVGSGAWASQTSGKKNGRNGVVHNAEPGNAFPSLPPAPKPKFPPVSAPPSRSSSPSINFSTIRSNGPSVNRKPPQVSNYAAPTRTASSPALSTHEFPSLPVKPRKQHIMVLKPRTVEPHDDSLTILRPSRLADDSSEYSDSSNANGNSAAGNRKGKGKKKTVLYHIGV